MTPTDATKVARLIAATWPTVHLSVTVWSDAVERFDYDAAIATLRALREDHEYPPSVAAFIARHRELSTRDAPRLHEPCGLCENTGWRSNVRTPPGYTVPIHFAYPCSCSRGRDVNPGYQRAVSDKGN